jgi:ATP/maltotriose-dependent transcriptional regulator MalT
MDRTGNKMFIGKFSIGFSTVDSHIRKIYDQLHLSGMTKAVSKAVRKRIV